MAGYTDSVFRLLCKNYGAGLVYTEFVSAEGIIRKSKKTFDYLKFNIEEHPIAVQIFGHDPYVMADAARYVEENYQPDIIDLNFACSVESTIIP